MTLAIAQTTAPQVPILTTAEAKLFLRVGNAVENDLIDSLVLGALDAVQGFTGRQLVNAVYTWNVDRWPRTSRPFGGGPWDSSRPRSRSEFVVPFSPLASVASVKYYDVAGDQQTLSSSVYVVVTDEQPGKIRLGLDQTWIETDGRLAAIEIIFTAGYGTAASDVPAAALSAVRLILGDLYWHRSATAEKALHENPAVMALLNAVGRLEIAG